MFDHIEEMTRSFERERKLEALLKEAMEWIESHMKYLMRTDDWVADDDLVRRIKESLGQS